MSIPVSLEMKMHTYIQTYIRLHVGDIKKRWRQREREREIERERERKIKKRGREREREMRKKSATIN